MLSQATDSTTPQPAMQRDTTKTVFNDDQCSSQGVASNGIDRAPRVTANETSETNSSSKVVHLQLHDASDRAKPVLKDEFDNVKRTPIPPPPAAQNSAYPTTAPLAGANSSITRHNDNTTSATPFSFSSAPGAALRVRPPLIKIESQELLPTRRPDLSGARRLSSSSSVHSLRPLINECQTSLSSRNDKEKTPRMMTKKQVPKPILKKTRPVLLQRHQVHPHLGPTLQYQHLERQQLQMQQQMQQMYHHQEQPSSQQAPQRRGVQRPRILQQHSQGSFPLSLKLPQLKLHIPSKTTYLQGTPPLPNGAALRPLPTPPVTKHVRWATHTEVHEIWNIDDLILLGYYDDYDSDLGWDYRDESFHNSDDSNSYSGDSDRDSDGEGADAGDSKEDQGFSNAALARQPVCYSDLVQLQHPNPSHLQPPYCQPQYLQHLPVPASLDDGFEAESETSVMDEESEIAEDELIQRFNMDSLFGSIGPSQGIAGRLQFFKSPTTYPGLERGNSINSNDSSRSSHSVGRRLDEPPSFHAKALPPIPPSRTHSLPVSMAPATDHLLPSRLKSPPPPGLSRLQSQVQKLTTQEQQVERQQVPRRSIAAMLSSSRATEPVFTSETAPWRGTGATQNDNRVEISRVGPPRMDRSHIMAQVAEHKKNGTGAFARRARQTSHYEGSALCRVDTTTSISSSASTLTPSWDSSSSLASPSPQQGAGMDVGTEKWNASQQYGGSKSIQMSHETTCEPLQDVTILLAH